MFYKPNFLNPYCAMKLKRTPFRLFGRISAGGVLCRRNSKKAKYFNTRFLSG
jgi:hypothetical protein